MDGKIYDHQGNLFFPTQDQAMLYKNGWRITKIKHQGCVKIVHWVDPIPQRPDSNKHDVWTQGSAVQIQRQRNKNPLPILIFFADQAQHMFDIDIQPDTEFIVLIPVGVYEDEKNQYDRMYICKAAKQNGLLSKFSNKNDYVFGGGVIYDDQQYRMFLTRKSQSCK